MSSTSDCSILQRLNGFDPRSNLYMDQQYRAALSDLERFCAQVNNFAKLILTHKAELPSSYKTSMCKNQHANRDCSHMECRFAHSLISWTAARCVYQEFKTTFCDFTHYCLNGPACKYIHPIDIRNTRNEDPAGPLVVLYKKEKSGLPAVDEESPSFEREVVPQASLSILELYAETDPHFSSSYDCQIDLLRRGLRLQPEMDKFVKFVRKRIKTFENINPDLIACSEKINLCKDGNMCPDLGCKEAHNLDTIVAYKLLNENSKCTDTDIIGATNSLLNNLDQPSLSV